MYQNSNMQNMFPCFYFSITYRFTLLSKLFHLKKAARKSPQRQSHSPPSRAEVPQTATLTAACDSFSQALPVIGKRTSTHPNEDGNISNNSKGSEQRFYHKRIGAKNPNRRCKKLLEIADFQATGNFQALEKTGNARTCWICSCFGTGAVAKASLGDRGRMLIQL